MNERPAPDAPATAGDWCGPRRFALVLAILILAAFWKVLLGWETFAVRDFGIFSYPVAFFQRQCFWKGQLPWWNPLSCCGLPFLAQFNTLALYPPALIYLLLPLPWSLPFFCLTHLFLGGMGMYRLAARWTGSRPGAALAGVVFAFNGLTLNFLMWPSHTATFAWLPWVILLTETAWREGGRKLAPAALAAALQILAGGPETILFTWLFLLLLAVADVRRETIPIQLLSRRFFLTAVLALGLSAPQWLPFADFALHSSRNTLYASGAWSMPAWGWANFLVPLFHTFSAQGVAAQADQYWTSSYYAGIGTIFLAALAIWRGRGARVWLLGGLTAASLVLALGDHAYVYPALRRLLPFLGMFRYPIKFVIVTSALLPLLAAEAVADRENSPRSWGAEGLVGAAMVLAVGIILCFSWPAAMANALSRLGFLAASAGALYLFTNRRDQRRWTGLLLALVCWLDLVTAVPWQNPTLDPSVYQPNLGRLDAKLNPEPNPAESRLMMSSFAAHQLYYYPPPDLKTAYLLDRAVFLADCNLLDGLPKVDGFFSLYLRETDKVLWLLDDRTGPELSSLEDFLGVSQTIAPGKVYAWMPRASYLPIVTAGQAPIFADDQTSFAAIGQTNVDFRTVVYLPPEARSRVIAKREPSARIIDREFDNSRETLQVESPAAAMVYISQAYYHDWVAEVDGKPVPLWRANYAFQALEVPAGRHVVVLRYRDMMFRFGTLFFAWAGVVCLVLWFAPQGQKQPADINL